jgi:hypothetical protein
MGFIFFVCIYLEVAFLPSFPLKSLFGFPIIEKVHLLKIFLIFAAAVLYGLPDYDFKAN